MSAGQQPSRQSYICLAIFRMHHKIHPRDLQEIRREAAGRRWQPGPIPLVRLLGGLPDWVLQNLDARTQGDAHAALEARWGAFETGIAKQQLQGIYRDFIDTDASPIDERAEQAAPTVVHLPHGVTHQETREGHWIEEKAFFEIIPMSSRGSLGSWSDPPNSSGERDSFLCVWILGEASTRGVARTRLYAFNRFWTPEKATPLTRYVRHATQALSAHESEEHPAKTRRRAGEPSAHLPDQTPHLLISTFGDGEAGDWTKIADFIAQPYRVARPESDSYVNGPSATPSAVLKGWAISGNAIVLEPDWAPPNQGDDRYLDRRLRYFFSDGAVTFRAAVIQARQLEAFENAIQEIIPDRRDGDAESRRSDAEQTLALWDKYHVFRRRYYWNRIGRATSGNTLLQYLQGDWGVDDYVRGLDDEMRDYSERARQHREDLRSNRAERWQTIAQIASLLAVGLAVLSTWATFAAVPDMEEDWSTRGSIVWMTIFVTTLVTTGMAWVVLVSRTIERNKRMMRGAAAGLTLAALAMASALVSLEYPQYLFLVVVIAATLTCLGVGFAVGSMFRRQ